MLGTHYFNSSHFSREAQCSPRTARRFLRSWSKTRQGEHVRLDMNELRAAVAAYQQYKANLDWTRCPSGYVQTLAMWRPRRRDERGRYSKPT